MHGGETPDGVASPHWKHGRRCRRRAHLPERLWESFEASISDPDLCSLRVDIATLDARIDDLLDRVDTGESGELWKALLEAARALQTAQEKANRLRDPDRRADAAVEVQQGIETLQDLCREGGADYAAWGEVLTLFQLRAKLVDSETRRRQALKTDVPVERAAAMVQEFEACVKAHVKDPAALREISALLGRLSEEVGGDS